MKYLLFLSFVFLSLNIQAQNDSTIKRKVYKNDIYKFSVEVPITWKLYGQKNDTLGYYAIVDWGLAPVYSELEKTDIENSISITAYKKTNIQSLPQLIEFEYLRRNPSNFSMEPEAGSKNGYIIHYKNSGLDYKGKSYFVFRDGIGYIVTFMATPGTYDINVPAFELFYKNISYL